MAIFKFLECEEAESPGYSYKNYRGKRTIPDFKIEYLKEVDRVFLNVNKFGDMAVELFKHQAKELLTNTFEIPIAVKADLIFFEKKVCAYLTYSERWETWEEDEV